MLYTNLNHLESAAQYAAALSENENVMIVCGRMGSCASKSNIRHPLQSASGFYS